MQIEERAKILLVEMFGIAESKLTPEASLLNDLDLDSIDIIDLLMKLNDEFATDFSPFDFENCNTLQQFTARLNQTNAN